MNKEITNNEFNSLKEDEKNNIIKALHEAGEPDKIIELLSAVPLESLSNLLLSLLAASYNNVKSYDKAMEVMEFIPEQERDAKWYYRYGYSLLYKDFPIASDQVEEVLAMFDKACEKSMDDEVKNWCGEHIFYNPKLEETVQSKEASFPNIYDYYIHSDYANEEGSASEEEAVGTFCGSVLLSEDEWDKDKLISDLQVDWGIELPKEDTEDEDTIVTDIDKCRIVISKFPEPVPNEEAEINAENNWMWEDAVEATKTHKAHIVVAILGDEEDLIVKGLLYTKIMATCCKQEKAIGVFTSGVVFEPCYYMKSAEMIRDEELPIFTWAWFGLYRTENGLSTYTYGMRAFGKLELEILDADEDAGKLLSFISAIASYILQDDVKLKDGETIGLSKDDIHQITLSKGVALPDQDTLKISYEKKKKSLGGRDKEKFTMKTELIYNKENREEFFAKIDELTEKDKHTECINALESIPAEERDYEITYKLVRALQNFAIVGDDDKGTEYEIGYEALLKSLEILESIREEGINRPEWNMRMAYGYQYLFRQEEKAIPYAQRWAELDPEDKNALEVIKECQEEIEKRKKIREKCAEIEGVVKEEFEAILKEHGIENANDYNSRSEEEFEAIAEKITKVKEKYDLNDDYIEGLLDEILVGDEDDGEIIED